MTTAPLPNNQSQEKLKNCRMHFPAHNTGAAFLIRRLSIKLLIVIFCIFAS